MAATEPGIPRSSKVEAGCPGIPSDAELGFCPIARAARLLGDTWTLLIVYNLADGPRRFSQLEEATGMSPRVLAGRLRELEGQGMLTRTQYPEIPPRVEYALTDKGTATLPTLEALRVFGARWLNGQESAALDNRRTRQTAAALTG
ncbi:MAG TPA: helix-turn-helix domain-containing protein [Chloroflexota bacterium]|jgi:DNA-binding HxlR family transcriptional regulator|nr:helix-turn-helix domain-containing protein [Chloroflexota bacterium]